MKNGVLATVFVCALVTAATNARAAEISEATAKVAGAQLVVRTSLTGLPTDKDTTLRATATARVTYVCVNKGGNVPASSKKRHTFTKTVTTSVTIGGEDGSATRTLRLSPPPSSGLTCPPGQESKLASVTYSNVRVVDVTNKVSRSVSGTFTAKLIALK